MGTPIKKTRQKLRENAIGCLDPRLRTGPVRCAENLFHYSQRIVERLGVTNGQIVAQLHDYCVVKVTFSVEEAFSVQRTRSEAVLEIETTLPEECGASAHGSYSIEKTTAMLRQRLSRLLRYFDIRYGKVVVDIVRGKVVRISPIPALKRKDCEMLLLSRFFSRAPFGRVR